MRGGGAAARSGGRWPCADRPSRGSRKSSPMWNDRPAKPRSSGVPLPVSSAPIVASITPSAKSRCTDGDDAGPVAAAWPCRRRSLPAQSSVSSTARQSRPFHWPRDGRDQIVASGCGIARFSPAAPRHDNGAHGRYGRTLDQATAAQRTEIGRHLRHPLEKASFRLSAGPTSCIRPDLSAHPQHDLLAARRRHAARMSRFAKKPRDPSSTKSPTAPRRPA